MTILAQRSELYPGVDNWTDYLIEKGEIIAQFDWRSKNAIERNLEPVSVYFSDQGTLQNSLNKAGMADAQKFAEKVQILPRNKSSEFGRGSYPENVVVYQVEKPMMVAKSVVENNPLYGNGGVTQYHFPIPQQDLITKGYIKKVDIIPTVNKDHQLGWMKSMEEGGMNRDEIERKIPQKHNELVNEWLKGTQEQRERAMNIIGMEREYERLMAEREKGMEKQGSEIQHEPVVKSSEMEQNLSAQNLEKGIDASPLEVSAEKSGIEMEISGESSGLEIGGEGPSPGMETDGGMEMGME